MLTALTIALLIGQRQLPTAHPSTWDGVPGSDVIQTDEATGEIIYPMAQRPPDALALGCVFGRSNVRCPKPVEPVSGPGTGSGGDRRTSGSSRFGEIEFASADEDPPVTDRERVENAFDWFAEAYVKAPDGPSMTEHMTAAETSTEVIFPSDMLTGSGIDPGNEENEKYSEAEPEQDPQARSGCHREEYRNEDGSGYGVRFVCSSGDQRLLNGVMDALQPSPN